MARKFVSALLTSVLLLVSWAAPSAARNSDIEVEGHDLEAAGLFQFRDRCSTFATTTPPAPDSYLWRSGTRGTHSIGWQYAETDWEVGAMAPVPEPTELTVFSEDVHSPGGDATGHVVAFYYDATAGYTEGYWVGFAGLSHAGNEWATYERADTVLTWSYFQTGYSEVNAYSGSVRDFATRRGGDGFGAWVGIALGCGGERFFVDRLRVGDGSDLTTYDFEGVSSKSHLEWSKDGETVRDGNLTIQYGQKVWMLGHSHGKGTHATYTGLGVFWAKTQGRSKFRKQGSGAFDPTYYAALKVSPRRETVYRFTSEGSDVFDTSVSEQITVQVQAAVRAKVLDRTLMQGQLLKIKGSIKPGNKGVKVTLQRRVNGDWVTLDRSRTRSRGKFGLAVRARVPGTWTVRVAVADGKGNLGTDTRPVDVTVKRRPAPQPGPTPGPTPGPQTPAPTESEPPPPTPDTPPSPSRVILLRAGDTGPVTSVPTCDLAGPYAVPCAPVAASE